MAKSSRRYRADYPHSRVVQPGMVAGLDQPSVGLLAPRGLGRVVAPLFRQFGLQ